jgi:hypothetical protein
MEQTVMVFADAAARTTALTGVVSEGMLSYLKSTKQVEVYNGSAWVASDDPNAIQNTIVDAKGDLITATAADTPARLAVGSNGDTLVADSAATTGLRWSNGLGLAQPVINGAFDVWQRGTSFTPTAASLPYTADRWVSYRAVTGYTVTRQTTSDTTNLPFIQYCARVQRTNGNTATDIIYLNSSIETANTIPYAGRTITMSFYARAGANFSASSNSLNVELYTGTGTDQQVNVGYTGVASPISTNVVLTTTWQRFSVSVTLNGNVTEFAPYFRYTPTGTAGAADYFEITGVQIDLGQTALPFRRAGGTIQGEIALAQRYYWRVTADASNTTAKFGNAGTQSSTTAYALVNHPVPMRVIPTSIDFSNLAFKNTALTQFTASSVALTGNNQSLTQGFLTLTCSGMTANQYGWLESATSSTGFIGFSAEL